MSHSPVTGLSGYPFTWWRDGVLMSKYLFQNTALMPCQNVYRLGAQHFVPIRSALGIV